MSAATHISVDEIPESWSQLARNLGVPQSHVSKIVRTLLSVRKEPVPNTTPSPKIVGKDFVDQVKTAILKTSRNRDRTPPKESIDTAKKITHKRIRECIDEHEKLLGENLLETVADELNVSLAEVREVMRQRWEALKLERKILREMQEDARATAAAQAAHEAAQARQAAEAAERAKPRLAVTPLLPPQASASSATAVHEKDARAVRPTGFPERGENVGLDETLRAAWIAIRAGLPDVLGRTAAAVEEVVRSEVTFGDVEKAIEAAYWERPEGVRKTMERRAERLKGEKT